MDTNDKKRAIVTGASSGIGRETVRQLADDGWRVLAVARRQKRLDELAAVCAGRVTAFACDVAADDAATQIAAAAAAHLGGLDLLVNNAGTSWVGPAAEMPADALDQILSLNIRGLVLLSQAAIPLLAASPRGQIINVSSVCAQVPMASLAAYCASKAAVTMFSRVLAMELAPQGIRVNVLSPTGTDTELFEKVGVDVDRDQLVPVTDMAALIVLMTRWPDGVDIPDLITQKRGSP